MKRIDLREGLERIVLVILGKIDNRDNFRKKSIYPSKFLIRWGGVNCNVCQEDKSCQPFKGSNATCIKSAIGLKSMHAWCATTSMSLNINFSHDISLKRKSLYLDIPWIDNTHVSLSCEWEKSECVFQFWKDSEEQFYCELSECSQSSKVFSIFYQSIEIYSQKLYIKLLEKMMCKVIVPRQIAVA